jgi:hypothetical protein
MDPDLDNRIIFKRAVIKYNGGLWTRFNRLMQSTAADCLKHNNEPSGYIKGREFIYLTSQYQLPKRVIV